MGREPGKDGGRLARCLTSNRWGKNQGEKRYGLLSANPTLADVSICAAVDRRENLRLQHSASPALRDANFDFPQRKNTQVDNSQDEEMNPTIRERFSAGPALESKNVTTTNANPILPQPRHQNLGAVRDYHYISKLEADPGTWLARSEVPTSNEIMMAPADDSIPRNITESAWESKEQYLSAHYELIREDAVLPLRAAVHQVRRYVG